MAYHTTKLLTDVFAPIAPKSVHANRIVDLVPSAHWLIRAATILGPVTAQTTGGPVTINSPASYAELTGSRMDGQGVQLDVVAAAWQQAILFDTEIPNGRNRSIEIFGQDGCAVHKIICNGQDKSEELYSIEIGLGLESQLAHAEPVGLPEFPPIDAYLAEKALGVLFRVAAWQALPLTVVVTNSGCRQTVMDAIVSVSERSQTLIAEFESGGSLYVRSTSMTRVWESKSTDGQPKICIAAPLDKGWLEISCTAEHRRQDWSNLVRDLRSSQ